MEIPQKELEYLKGVRFGVLATIGKEALPHQTVMWYDVRDAQTIMMNTKAGRIKDRHIQHDARVSLCVPDGYSFVTVSGTITTDDDQETAQADIASLAVRYDGEEAAKPQIARFAAEHRVTLLLHADHIISNL